MMQLFQISETTAAYRRLFFHAVDATDGIAAETGLTGTGWVSENGATPAASPSIVEINATNMPGRYYVELIATDLSTLGIIEFRYKAAACAEVIARGQVVPWDPYDSVRAGLTALPNAAAEAAGGLFTRGTGAGQVNQQANGQIDVNIERVRNAVLNALQSGRMDSYAGAMVAALITATEAPNLDAAISTRSSHGDPDPSNYIDASISTRSSHGDPDPSGYLDVSVASRATPAQVNTEVLDVMNVDTITLPGQEAPPLAPTHRQMDAWVYKMMRNRKTMTNTQLSLFADDETTVDAKATASEAGGTTTLQEMVTGP